MDILILGGTGAMGRPLAEILGNTHRVLVTSRVPRVSKHPSVQYIQGDAHEESFLTALLERYAPFDAIVDFMIYSTAEFNKRVPLLLSATKQYVFLSSSRVYADSLEPITEQSPRLLDTSADQEYLQTDEYALTKARQEDLLKNSGLCNWTVIRPYITYNTERLQLGVFEKESWLFRALHGRTVVMPRDIAQRYTTLTYGGDVAQGIARVVGNEKALGEQIHITSPESIQWGDVLEVYLDTLEAHTGRRPLVLYTESSEWLRDVKRDYEAVCYDRLFDRRFNNAKFHAICGPYPFLPAKEGLKICLTHFLQKKAGFQKLHWKYEAYVDRMTGEQTPLCEITDEQARQRYCSNRWPTLNCAENNV